MYEASLVYRRGEADELIVLFGRQIIVGRPPAGDTSFEAYLPIDDPTVSRRHCVVRQWRSGKRMERQHDANRGRHEPDVAVGSGAWTWRLSVHHTLLDFDLGIYVGSARLGERIQNCQCATTVCCRLPQGILSHTGGGTPVATPYT
jgi:hypothetical protein